MNPQDSNISVSKDSSKYWKPMKHCSQLLGETLRDKESFIWEFFHKAKIMEVNSFLLIT